jgi:hypothetical protein
VVTEWIEELHGVAPTGIEPWLRLLRTVDGVAMVMHESRCDTGSLKLTNCGGGVVVRRTS